VARKLKEGEGGTSLKERVGWKESLKTVRTKGGDLKTELECDDEKG